ncbi:hypothetical protein KQH54_02965 [bacterium]|nr:hypothetical protein [bacterium]
MRDLRRYAKKTNIRLLIGFIILLLLVGDGLIYLFYGSNGAILGLICMLSGLVPLGLIFLLLWGLEVIAKKANDE